MFSRFFVFALVLPLLGGLVACSGTEKDTATAE